MTDNDYINELEFRINELITQAKNKYNILKEQSRNITSVYSFYQDVDDLAYLIESILSYRQRLERTKRFDNSWQHKMTIPSPEEESEIRYRKFCAEKAILDELITKLDKAIAEVKQEELLSRLINQLEFQRFYLTSELQNIQSQLRIFEGNPDLTDGEIDIYINGNDKDLAFQGTIYLHGKGVEVGVIDYRGPVADEWLGDIGYTIRKEHQGHNYAYKALCLTSQIIAAKGIDKVTITTYKANVASVKTIEKFGGVLNRVIREDVLSYTCEIKPILQQSQVIKK